MTYVCEPRMNTSPQLYRYPNKQPNDNMIKYEYINNRPPMAAYDAYPPVEYPPPPQPDQYIYNNTMERQPNLYQPYQPPQYTTNNVDYNYSHDNLTPMPLPQYDVHRYKHIDPDFLDEAIQCIPQLDAMTMDMNAQYRPSNATINPAVYTAQPARYPSMASSYSPSSNAPSSTGSLQEHNMYSEKPQPSRKVGEKPNPRLCRVPGCNKGIRSRGLCKGHGGGRRCQTAGCKISDQGGGHCIAHGGGRRCSEPGCTRSAQARGRCKCHGGGRPCKMEGCGKNSQRSGYCMSHAKLVEQQKAAALNDGMI